ncbi:MAG TPA: hypothetical protein VL021_04370 [Brumimicrobium sp.]|nr:hypothetical protein [Brumimicrobium sp.]
MSFLIKKEYRLSLVLMLVFGLFLFTVDQTSERVVSHFTEIEFRYEKRAFLKMIYLVLLFVALSGLAKLNQNEETAPEVKGRAYSNFIYISVFSFFVGWAIHLYFVIKTLQTGGSFMKLEDQFWIYNASDFTLAIGFCLAGLFVLRPAIHPFLQNK